MKLFRLPYVRYVTPSIFSARATCKVSSVLHCRLPLTKVRTLAKNAIGTQPHPPSFFTTQEWYCTSSFLRTSYGWSPVNMKDGKGWEHTRGQAGKPHLTSEHRVRRYLQGVCQGPVTQCSTSGTSRRQVF
jgi:hypothetical protein